MEAVLPNFFMGMRIQKTFPGSSKINKIYETKRDFSSDYIAITSSLNIRIVALGNFYESSIKPIFTRSITELL